MNALDLIAQGSMKEETPKFQIGDTVKVAVKIREGSRERIQMFEGTVIAIKRFRYQQDLLPCVAFLTA